MVIRDFARMRDGAGMLLAELMRIRAESDYGAAGINPELSGTTGSDGRIAAVTIGYPRDYTRQQLRYAGMYRPQARGVLLQ